MLGAGDEAAIFILNKVGRPNIKRGVGGCVYLGFGYLEDLRNVGGDEGQQEARVDIIDCCLYPGC